jgi:hypothetical protein
MSCGHSCLWSQIHEKSSPRPAFERHMCPEGFDKTFFESHDESLNEIINLTAYSSCCSREQRIPLSS